jgi:hypothetical protein
MWTHRMAVAVDLFSFSLFPQSVVSTVQVHAVSYYLNVDTGA